MKRVVLALVFCFSLGCVNVVYADFWGRLAHAADVNWRTLQKDTTNFFERNWEHKPSKSDSSEEKEAQTDKDSIEREKVKVDKNGIEINNNNREIKIDKNGLEITWHGNN
ncbi:MAG: hypothetical protein LBJ79_00770 [Endomicrobium sp.]|jgi:hypothetical protein|nr:hypothetical protein [Endomicrobium sp.]